MMTDFLAESHACLLHSNGAHPFYAEDEYEYILAFGCHEELNAESDALVLLQSFISRNKGRWMFGVISYDVKNEIENLSSKNPARVSMPLIHFFVPEKIILKKKHEPPVLINNAGKKVIADFKFNPEPDSSSHHQLQIKSSLNKEEYLKAVSNLKEHIQYGDIYEVTFCLDFFAENVKLNPWHVYNRLSSISPAPMSCYYRAGEHYLISSSPERFLKKKGERLLSRPIKGTVRRGKNALEDESLKQELAFSTKERSENVMIVDLVRNDLSRIAQRGSVRVDELFGIYTLPHVHQMISTISCRVKPELHFTDILRAVFPMGSMTGAPKISAMNLIDSNENFRRGWFSGCAGYITPEGDFDFNVIIRSILYNEREEKISFPAGSAITIRSNPEKEFEECLLKASALRKILEG